MSKDLRHIVRLCGGALNQRLPTEAKRTYVLKHLEVDYITCDLRIRLVFEVRKSSESRDSELKEYVCLPVKEGAYLMKTKRRLRLGLIASVA